MWRELQLTVDASVVDFIGEELIGLGAQAITCQDGGHDPIFEPQRATPIVWQKTHLTVLFLRENFNSAAEHFLQHQQQAGVVTHYHIRDFDDQNWVELSHSNLKPMDMGNRVWVVPSWHQPPDPLACNIFLDPGQAFGTGTHPTTALCLKWLAKNYRGSEKVVDYGTGSGILGIAANKLGGKMIYAVDHDPIALQTTSGNAQKNNILPGLLQTFLPDEMPKIKAELIMANILANPLIRLAPTFAELSAPGGTLLLSGILAESAQNVASHYAHWYNFQELISADDWVLLIGIRANNI